MQMTKLTTYVHKNVYMKRRGIKQINSKDN